MSAWLLAVRISTIQHKIAIDSARSFTKSTNRIPIRVGRLLLLFPWMCVYFFCVHSILSPPSVRRKWYAGHFGRAIGRQTEAAHDKLNCYQMKRTQHNTSEKEKKQTHTTKINWFIFYWNEANVSLAQALVYTKGPASSTIAYVRGNSMAWNREAGGVRKRTYAEICVNLCLPWTSRYSLTHGEPWLMFTFQRDREPTFYPAQFIRSVLAFAHFASGIRHSTCIWRSGYETMMLNYYCQMPKQTISVRTLVSTTIRCDRIASNINLRFEPRTLAPFTVPRHDHVKCPVRWEWHHEMSTITFRVK